MIDNCTTALQIAHHIKSLKISPTEVLEHFWAQIDAKNSYINAVIWEDRALALKKAQYIESELSKKNSTSADRPFLGVPLLVKDLTEVKDQPCTMGSVAYKNEIGKNTGDIVRFSEEAGFILAGRTNSPEFGILPVTENKLYGTTSNPWNLNHTAGGSSGGAAAAVASGMSPIALASDGGGSIRIPASCNGLVGLKPSRGRIPRGPIVSDVFHGFVTDGCVSKSVQDTAAFLDATARDDRNAWYSAPTFDKSYLTECQKKPGKLRIGFNVRGLFDYETAPEVIEVFEQTIEQLQTLGHHVFEQKLPFHATGNVADSFLKIWMTGSAYTSDCNWQVCEDLTQAMRKIALKQTSVEYVQAVMHLQLFSRHFAQFFHETMDVFLTPTLAIEPPENGWLFETGEKDPVDLLLRASRMVPSTGWVNATGQPAISLPMGWSPNNIPVGMQFVGQPYREDTLLKLAFQIEQNYPWSAKYREI